MYKFNRKLVSCLLASSVLLAGCSDDGFEAYTTPAPASVIPTGIADQNSFTVAREFTAVEGFSYAGVTSAVTVFVADRHNHPVPDDTPIRFLTNGGAIEPQCLTESGSCTVNWNSQDPRPTSGIATIIAYTDGEESFLDINDNDAYDFGEQFTDLSEPFIDEIDNDTFDAGSEEFVDRDADNEFDPADGRYTGESCVGDITVCNRTRLFVWGETSIVMSTSFASISFNPAGPLTVAVSSVTPIDIIVTDLNGNPMAEGTTIDVEASSGSVDESTFTVGPGATVASVNYTAPAASGSDSLKVTVTSPESESETWTNLAITIP